MLLVWVSYLFVTMGSIWLGISIWAFADSSIHLVAIILGVQAAIPYWWLVVLVMFANVICSGKFTYYAFIAMQSVSNIKYLHSLI